MFHPQKPKVWLSVLLVAFLSAHAGCNSGFPVLNDGSVTGNGLRGERSLKVNPERGLESGSGWLTSWDLAQRESLRTGKPIMALFTGSDWCGPCIGLKKNVLSTSQFKGWADQNVVLLELDYPKTKNQSPALKDQNRDLASKYNIAGYPTILFIENNGRVKGKLGHGTDVKRWLKSASAIVGS